MSVEPRNVSVSAGARLPALTPKTKIEGVRAWLVRRPNGYEFLPAHLEILTTPPSPKALAFNVTLCLFFACALLWSFVAEIDIHAVASGRIQPSGRSKVVQPFETARVKAVHVTNGTRVKAGDPLVEFDATEAKAELRARQGELDAYEAQIVRRTAAIEAIKANATEAEPKFPDAIPAAVRERERSAMLAELRQYAATRAGLKAQLAEKVATQARLTGSISARERLLAVIRERADMRETLVARSAGTRAAVIDALQQVEQTATDLAVDQGQLGEAKAAAVSLERHIDQLASETLSKQSQDLADAAQKRDTAREEVVKAQLRLARLNLVAPLDGTVQQLAVTTVGQVVSAGQAILVVVPSEGPIEVEALVLNQDIGFVVPGQAVVIKVEAFPFTRYGTLEGRVVQVSRDAVDEREAKESGDAASTNGGAGPVSGAPRTQNLVFPVTIALSQTTIEAEGKPVQLGPGMTVTAEIRTGSRRVIDYALSPLKETTSTAGHER